MAVNPLLNKLVARSSQWQYWNGAIAELEGEADRQHRTITRLETELLAAKQAFEHTRAELDYAELMRNEADEKAA